MTDQNTTESTTVVDGPRIVRARDGKKGPGKVVVVAASIADADKVAEALKADGTGEVIISEYDAPQIMTFEDWKDKTEADRAKDKARKELLASLSDEQKALLGVKA